MKTYARAAWLIFIGMSIIFVDFVTKAYVYYLLPLTNSLFTYPYGGRGVFQDFFGIDFAISLAINRGAAWGMFADFQLLLLAVRILTIFGMLIYLVFINNSRRLDLPFTFILAGAIGNVVDFFLYGFVIDFLHFNFWGYHFPVFNVADTFITIGVGLLFIMACLPKKNRPARV